MAEGQGAEKLSTSYAAKETAVQKFKEKENEKKPESYANPTADIIEEKALDTETDKITAEIAEAEKVLAKPYGDKLTAKLNTVVAGEKAKLNQKLATINKDSEVKLISLTADAVAKLATFRTIPEVAQIYELVEKKDQIAAISEMKLSTYESNSGYHKVIDAKFDAIGFTEPKRQEMQKILGVKVDGKVGPETINELSKMLKLGLKEVKFDKKTVSADGKKEFDANGKVIEPPKVDEPVKPVPTDDPKPAPAEPKPEEPKPEEPKPEEPKPEEPKPEEPKPEEPAEEEKPPEEPKGKSAEMVFSEVSQGFDDINGNELYQFFDFSLTRTNNVITIDHKFYDGATKVCEVTVDEIAGTIKFADGTDLPQDNPFAAIKQRMDAYILPSQLHLVSGEKNNEFTVKLPGEMRLQKYSLSRMTQKSIGYDVIEADGNFVLHFKEKTDPPANVGKVIISKTGATVEQDPAAKLLLNVDGGQIAVSDKPEEPKPEEPKPEEPKPEEPKPEEPKPEEPKPEEPKPEEPKVEEPTVEAEALKADIARLRSELQAKKAEFTEEKLQGKLAGVLKHNYMPEQIQTFLELKIRDKILDHFVTQIDPIIATLEGKLSTAQTCLNDLNQETAAKLGIIVPKRTVKEQIDYVRSTMKEAEAAMPSLNIDNYLKTPEMKAYTDRLIVPMQRIGDLMFIIRENQGPKVLAAKEAVTKAIMDFLYDNTDKAVLDSVALEQSIIAAMAEDTNLSEDQQKVFNAAARVTKWHVKNDSIDGPVEYSFEGRKPQNGDYKLVPDSGKAGGDAYGLWVYKAGQDKETLTYSEGWEFVANYSKTVFDDKVAKYETIDKTYAALKESIATAHQALIDANTSNLYGDFEISADGLTLSDSKHSGDHEATVCEFAFDEETGKITFRGKEIKAEEVAGKMREAGDAYIRNLEYPSETVSVRQEEDASNLKIKFKDEMNEHAYQIDDEGYSGGRTVAKVGGKFVVTYTTLDQIPGGAPGAQKQFPLATFTISKNGSVAVTLSPKYKGKIIAQYQSGQPQKIILKTKEEKEKTEGCKSDRECPGNQICVDGKCVKPYDPNKS